MKPGSRTLGVAVSAGDEVARLAGAVVRADGPLDGLVYGTCRVGGTDATAAIAALFHRLDREDVQRLLLAGVAPAWFNVVDLDALAEAVDRPVIAVSFESSPGLEPALREHFSGEALAERLAVYRSLPPQHRVAVDDHDLFVRAVGVDADRAAEVVRQHTDIGGRPEPVRVAGIAASAHREAVEREE